jgi:CRISPR-associated endonuclease/helicase Cas3
LKYSKLVIDEIQAYSPRVVATLIYGLKIISKMGGHFAIITATFPPVLKDFMQQQKLVLGEQYQLKDFSKESNLQRHMFSVQDGEMNIEDIVRNGKEKKVLVICNTISKAQEIYEKILGLTDEVYLLHSHFIRKDRTLLEKKIIDFSCNCEKTGIWITTQIVEASLDIDFDILYTEMCSCDSLLQRMGRCNRIGRYIPSASNILIFDNKNGRKNIYDVDIYDRSVEFLKKYENQIFTEEMKTEYINKVYNTEEIKETSYYKEINKFLKHFEAIQPMEYSKQEADEQFRKIDSITIIPDNIYKKNRNLFDSCCKFLKEPHIVSEAKAILNAKMQSMTMSINIYNKRYPQGVEYRTIDGTDIHYSNLEYDFDDRTCKGKGLVIKKRI